MNKRLALLEELVRAGKADAFARYALALEYRREGRTEDAVATFRALRADEPAYVPMYLMAGQLLIDAGRGAEARDWLEAGVEAATARGDGKARSELLSALEQVAED